MSYRGLIILVVITLAGFAAFGTYWSVMPGGRSLDFIFTAQGLHDALSAWDANDRAYHVFGTRVLDSLFPLLYGVTIFVVCLRYATGWWRALLVSLTFAAIAADFTENQLNLALLAGDDVFVVHLWATWIKFVCLVPPILESVADMA